ncbi:hypothetical protein [Streptomyces milbemycinicus]|uniref:Transposase n=1 Tax=Streptomyces milbemycinicus TaxID=476552 RepID=A0ABW8M7Y7_9ACTN
MSTGNPIAGPGGDPQVSRAMACVIAAVLPRFDQYVTGEVLEFLEPATRFSRFARYRDRHGQPYRRSERHRCWTILHPRPGQLQPAVLLDTGLSDTSIHPMASTDRTATPIYRTNPCAAGILGRTLLPRI